MVVAAITESADASIAAYGNRGRREDHERMDGHGYGSWVAEEPANITMGSA